MPLEPDPLAMTPSEVFNRNAVRIQCLEDELRVKDLLLTRLNTDLKCKDSIIAVYEADLHRLRQNNDLLSACIDLGKLAKGEKQ